ncbi:MAG: histidine phosphatase family protein [Deltaproteobacteria bacterium]|nr:histidine phosphatase family protein [Deltaproteobacteria bacterium]
MPRLWLIRHGQSEANAGLRSASASEIPLTALGKQQAQAVAARFHEAPAGIVSSPFTRAVQTSAPTCARFTQSPAERWPIHEFTYLDAAKCHNTTSAERLPMVHAYWAKADPDYVDGPGVESFRQLLARVQAELDRVRARSGFQALFTHGQFMQAAMWLLGAGPQPATAERMAPFRSFMEATPVPNGAVLEVELGAGKPRLQPLATEHLRGLPLTY